MVLRRPGPIDGRPLAVEERPDPVPNDDQLLVRVAHCGVCRTDLHIVEGELPARRAAVVPGHEVVGVVERTGAAVRDWSPGDGVGVAWLGGACGRCEYCRGGRENLCDAKVLTGYTVDGGYAERAVVDARFALRLPRDAPASWAPFLCAGIVGYRALQLALPGPTGRIGFFGFGGSAHLTLQLAARLGYETVAVSRSAAHRELAARLGASETVAADDRTDRAASRPLDAAVVFAPAGSVVLDALARVKKGGTVSIAAIHLSPIPSIDYDRLLFGERRLVSVEANTRADAQEFLELAERYRLQSVVRRRPLAEANEALADLKAGRVDGAVVLEPGP